MTITLTIIAVVGVCIIAFAYAALTAPFAHEVPGVGCILDAQRGGCLCDQCQHGAPTDLHHFHNGGF